MDNMALNQRLEEMKMRIRKGAHKDSRQSNMVDIETECISDELSLMRSVHPFEIFLYLVSQCYHLDC